MLYRKYLIFLLINLIYFDRLRSINIYINLHKHRENGLEPSTTVGDRYFNH
jgi:hypothetical protein